MASVNPPVRVLAPYEAAFEEGTVSYTSIPAVSSGLRFIRDTDTRKI